MIDNQKEFFRTGITRNYKFRYNSLIKLKNSLIKNEEKIIDSINNDLGKSRMEIYTSEIYTIIVEINYMLKNLKKFMSDEKVKKTLLTFFGSGYIINEPYGVVLIIGPWNYPLHLSLLPLVGAIAAGNCIVIKPSEISENTSNLIKKIISETFDENYISVYEGGIDISTKLLEEKFDKIFFTGSPEIGKIVMKKASENLTPVTLELGGKNPCIVDDNVDIDIAVKRIIFGKTMNAGQTCVAPDYLIVKRSIKKKFLKKFKEIIDSFFDGDIKNSVDYSRIINRKHYERLKNYIKNSNVLFGGNYNDEEKFIEPTIVEINDLVMKDEIFGPILPIVEFEDIGEIIKIIDNNENPLSLYIFSRNKKFIEKVLSRINSGSVCINNTIFQILNHHLPFGGIGSSGMGRYHGKYSFYNFSNKRSVLKYGFKFDISNFYPPYKDKHKFIKRFFIR